MLRFVVVIPLIALGVATAPLRDLKRAFSLDLPEGYMRQDSTAPVIHKFVRSSVDQPDWAELNVMSFGKEIAQDLVIPRSAGEEGARQGAAKFGIEDVSFEYRTVKWKTFTLEVMVMHAHGEARNTIGFAARVPLTPEMIQVMVTGAEVNDAKLFAEFTRLIASINGETNWKTEKDQWREAGERTGFAVGLACVPCSIITVLIGWLLFRKRGIKS